MPTNRKAITDGLSKLLEKRLNVENRRWAREVTCKPGYKKSCGGCEEYRWCISNEKDAECWRDDAE